MNAEAAHGKNTSVPTVKSCQLLTQASETKLPVEIATNTRAGAQPSGTVTKTG